MKNYDSRVPVPPEDILIGVLNREDSSVEELLNYYDGYINAAASISVYNPAGIREGVFVSDDLKQDIILRILRSLPLIRQKVINRINPEPISEPCIIVIGEI